MGSAVIFHICAQGVSYSSRLIWSLMTSSATSRLRLDCHHIKVDFKKSIANNLDAYFLAETIFYLQLIVPWVKLDCGLLCHSVCMMDSRSSVHWKTLLHGVRVVTIYWYDGIPSYKHVRLSYRVHLLIYGIWRIKDAVSHLRLGNNFPLNCSLAPPHVQRRQHQRQKPLSLISTPRQNINQNW